MSSSCCWVSCGTTGCSAAAAARQPRPQAAARRPSRCAHEEGAVRMRPVVLSPLAALALAACGGGGPVDTGPPPDVKLDQANRAGTQALSVDMPSLAVREYKVALARAYERDDAGAIADVAYNLALAQMKSGDSKAALATLRDARADLDRRHVQIPAELFLVEAALNQAIAALPPSKQADLEADRQELQGRAALLDGRPAEALSLFEQSAANRQQALDYRGMARALSFAGDSALRSNRAADAADLFLRAGRSALLQGDTATALPLLKQAEDLARQTAQAGIVEEVARLRKAAAERTTR